MTAASDGGPLPGEWECAALPAGSVEDPEGLAAAAPDWIPAAVPGTAAGALRAAGRPVRVDELDDRDWWFRCRFTAPPGRHVLVLEGLATLADVWLDGRHLLRSENMFRSHRLPVELGSGPGELVVRCAALAPALAGRRPRPRWKTYLVPHQNLRWFRTSLLGRIPGWAVVPPPVGPWRPVSLRPAAGGAPDEIRLRATCDEPGGGADQEPGDPATDPATGRATGHPADPTGGGTVHARFVLRCTQAAPGARLLVAGEVAELAAHPRGDDLVLEGSVHLPEVARWWPHTHGEQPRYEVLAEVGGHTHRLGRVGFRTLAVDRRDGAFSLSVNGVPVFCRGACWLPVDPVALASPPAEVDRRLALARAAHMNMLRVPGTTVYQDRHFFERCDELGILVWHDCMFAFMDPPADEAFTGEALAEVAEALGAMDGHPSLAVVCGNQEVEEVAAMNGLPPGSAGSALFDGDLAALVEREAPGVPYVPSNPTGGDLPFRMDAGVSQYFGIGGYLRPVDDARRAGVRFAAECLAFATPPEPDTVEEACGGAYRAGHDPRWKEGVHHDAGRSWDMEDVRDHYVAELFGTDPRKARYVDAERALELGRAANAHLMGAAMAEWRRAGSPCGGALVLAFADLRAGAGWGVVDALGRPKAPWYVLRRAFRPVALLATDEGLNGLALHVVNDTAAAVRGRLVVELVARGELVVERGEVPIEVGPRGACTVGAESVLGGFRDVTYAYRFSPPAHDAVVATLWPGDGPDGTGEAPLARVVHLPLGQERPVEADLGLSAVACPAGEGRWQLDVRTERLAQWVTVRVPGFTVGDSWFHLPPGGACQVALEGGGAGPPRGTVQALNWSGRAPIRVQAGEAR